ncbi:hypothetical protein ARMSODRAFT_966532, partial [Armillaria solidipes]
MHNRNIYRRATDSVKLAKVYPELENQCLTKTLSYRDFGVHVVLPEDRLCPPVYNGILYIMREHPSSSVCGIDIGTGASAIYPLSACKLELDWSFVANARRHIFSTSRINISRKHFGNRVHVLQAHPGQPILFPLNTYPDE